MPKNSKLIKTVLSKLDSLKIKKTTRKLKKKKILQVRFLNKTKMQLVEYRNRLVKKFKRIFASSFLNEKRCKSFYKLFRSQYNSAFIKSILKKGRPYLDSKVKKYAFNLLTWKKIYKRIKAAYNFQQKNRRLLWTYHKVNDKKLQDKSKSLYKYLKINNRTLSRLAFWKFIIKPIIFWFIYYFNIFFVYYFKTLFSLWIRRLMFIFNNNIKIFFFNVDNLHFNNFMWYYSAELLIGKIKPMFFFKKQYKFFNNFFNKTCKGKNSPFNTVHIDFFLNLKGIKYLFSNKKVWSRRYKITFAYVQLLKLHLFKTVEIGGWSRSTKNPRRNKLLNKSALKLRKSRRLILTAFKFFLKKPKYAAKWIKRRKFFKRLRKSQHYKFLQTQWDKRRLIKRPKTEMDTTFIKKRKVKSFWNTLCERTFYIRNAKKVELTGYVIEEKKSKRDIKQYIQRLKKNVQEKSVQKQKERKEYTPEQKIVYSRYKRFKARCNISCSYFEWLDHFKDTALENACQTGSWKPYGWQVPPHLLEGAISALPSTLSISFKR